MATLKNECALCGDPAEPTVDGSVPFCSVRCQHAFEAAEEEQKFNYTREDMEIEGWATPRGRRF
jgi:endogenous inhibitor of DNA gyrase (YacG/DUF329 family)